MSEPYGQFTTKFSKKGRYFHDILRSNLDIIIKRVDKMWDGLIYVCGMEGDGKTTFAQQLCFYFDRTFKDQEGLDRTCFNAKQFKEIINKATPKQAILFDESYLTFNTGSRMTKETREVKALLTMIRKKQLYIIVVAPTIFDIDYYLICFRSLALINIKAEGLTRGFFYYYNRKRKEQLYIKGKKSHDMNVNKPNFYGRFTAWTVLDTKAYEKKKDAGIKALLVQQNKRPSCPECDSRDIRFNMTEKSMYCRTCGCTGGERDFYYKCKYQRGRKK